MFTSYVKGFEVGKWESGEARKLVSTKYVFHTSPLTRFVSLESFCSRFFEGFEIANLLINNNNLAGACGNRIMTLA
jgi:hypothetical protein